MSLKAVLFERERLISHGSWTDSLCQLLLGLHRYQAAAIDLGTVLPMEKAEYQGSRALFMRGEEWENAVASSSGEEWKNAVASDCGEEWKNAVASDCGEEWENAVASSSGEEWENSVASGSGEDWVRNGLEDYLKKLGIALADCLLLADCAETLRLARAWGIAVLGYEPPGQNKDGDSFAKDLPMIVEGFEEVDFYFLERMYQRFHHLPWTVIETERCYLREITLEDLDALYQLYEPEEMTRYMEGLYEDRKKEEEYTKAYIEKMYPFYGYGLWLVVEKASGAIIGRAGLGNLEVDGEVQLELGYLIALEKQRQGFGYEVCRGILDYAREATDFKTIHCLIQENNKASIGLAEKLGFCWEKNVICNEKEMQRYAKILQT